jgi:hypothetical protein
MARLRGKGDGFNDKTSEFIIMQMAWVQHHYAGSHAICIMMMNSERNAHLMDIVVFVSQ